MPPKSVKIGKLHILLKQLPPTPHPHPTPEKLVAVRKVESQTERQVAGYTE